MSSFDLILLAIALSMDAMAVTISNALCFPSTPSRRRIAMACTFGLFQCLMPILGYCSVRLVVWAAPAEVGGTQISLPQLMETYSGFVALILLGFIGGQMLFDAVRELREPLACSSSQSHLGTKAIIAQAIATSIDAFAVGVTFASISANVVVWSSVIGIVTALLCLGSIWFASRLGTMFGARAKIVGGLVLIAIGIKAVL